MNAFTDGEAPQPERFDVPPELARDQQRSLDELRSNRDGDAARVALDHLAQVAAGADSMMPAILDAVRADATLGEICGALRAVFGEYRPASAAQI